MYDAVTTEDETGSGWISWPLLSSVLLEVAMLGENLLAMDEGSEEKFGVDSNECSLSSLNLDDLSLSKRNHGEII